MLCCQAVCYPTVEEFVLLCLYLKLSITPLLTVAHIFPIGAYLNDLGVLKLRLLIWTTRRSKLDMHMPRQLGLQQWAVPKDIENGIIYRRK
jgi:hypothetical protein